MDVELLVSASVATVMSGVLLVLGALVDQRQVLLGMEEELVKARLWLMSRIKSRCSMVRAWYGTSRTTATERWVKREVCSRYGRR